MKKYEVSFRPQAEADLFDLYRYIAEESGRAVAGAYIDRIESACLALETFPERGTRRDDLRLGLRMMGFERRVTIIFQCWNTKSSSYGSSMVAATLSACCVELPRTDQPALLALLA